MQYVQPIKLDVANRNLYKCIYAKQGDAKSRYIKATILANGEKVTISSGMTAKFRAEKPDGKAILNPAVVNDDGTVTFELTKQTLAAGGVVDADIVISSASGEEISTVPFKIEVEKAPHGSLTDSENEMLVLQKLIDDSEAALKKLGNVKDGKDGVSPTVSTAATTGGTKVTITDAKGSHEFVVKDGTKGNPGTAGQDGHSPVVTATKSGKTTTISVDGAAIATVEDGADGKPGAAGAGGITPTIGPNGTWHLGTTDTGKPSRGETGAQGTPGIYYGTTQPAGDTHPVWIDPGGDHDDGGLLPAVTAADNGKVLRVVSSAWAPVDMPSGGSGGETWELVAEATTTEIVNSLRVTFDACSAVFVEFCWGGVENDLGDIAIYPNQGATPYASSEHRAAAAKVKSSTAAKHGILCVRMDCRVGTYWTAVSNQKYRGDGAFGNVNADNIRNVEIGVDPNDQYSVISSYYMTPRNDTPASGVRSITAYGAGMAIGTRVKVWGVKK